MCICASPESVLQASKAHCGAIPCKRVLQECPHNKHPFFSCHSAEATKTETNAHGIVCLLCDGNLPRNSSVPLPLQTSQIRWQHFLPFLGLLHPDRDSNVRANTTRSLFRCLRHIHPSDLLIRSSDKERSLDCWFDSPDDFDREYLMESDESDSFRMCSQLSLSSPSKHQTPKPAPSGSRTGYRLAYAARLCLALLVDADPIVRRAAGASLPFFVWRCGGTMMERQEDTGGRPCPLLLLFGENKSNRLQSGLLPVFVGHVWFC